jgi:hypothetical protein
MARVLLRKALSVKTGRQEILKTQGLEPPATIPKPYFGVFDRALAIFRWAKARTCPK